MVMHMGLPIPYDPNPDNFGNHLSLGAGYCCENNTAISHDDMLEMAYNDIWNRNLTHEYVLKLAEHANIRNILSSMHIMKNDDVMEKFKMIMVKSKYSMHMSSHEHLMVRAHNWWMSMSLRERYNMCKEWYALKHPIICMKDMVKIINMFIIKTKVNEKVHSIRL